MKKWTLFSILLILLAQSACVPTEVTESVATPNDPYLEEELAEQAIATAYAKKTQIASRVSRYVKLSNGEQRYLAFWFTWNDETILMPLAEFLMANSGLATCRLESGSEIIPGKMNAGFVLTDDECVADEKAAGNAMPVIKIPRYFENGMDTQKLNVIDLNGEYAENLADIIMLIVKNDLLGSGDLILSIHQTNGLGGEPYDDETAVPTYVLPAEALQVVFSADQMGNFEDSDDVVYALEREFTWKIPDGYSDLDLSPGDENWFVLSLREMKAGNNQEEEYLGEIDIQIKGVGSPVTSDN